MSLPFDLIIGLGQQPFEILDDGSEIIIKPDSAVLDLPQNHIHFTLQSGLVQESSISETSSPDEVNVAFDDNVAGEAMDLPESVNSDSAPVSANAEINKFLKRPVEIYSYNWGLGGLVNDSFQPWFLYMNHPSIKKKLDNYYLFKGNLRVKFVINATPFYYGAMMVSYVPLTQFSNPVIAAAGVPNISYSQLPRVFLYPSVSQGASMLLPFVYHKKWLDLTVAADVQSMGTLHFRVLDALKSASASTTPITIKVYAWLEDVQISAPTVKFSLQSGKVDEYGQGIISKPASAIARAAGQLKNAPIIGPYATATQIAAGAVSSIAQLFGFTNVPVIADVHSMKPEPFPALAATDIGTSISKLTLDSKNELSVDPRICGCDFGDELVISNLVARESYLTAFQWPTSTATDDLLFNIGISPMYMALTPSTNQSVVNGTPMWMVSRMFDYWKGDIEVRFKIICSQYHRGRLRFSWDPRGDISNTTDSTTEVYTKIVDIAETTDVTIRIPYMAATEYLETTRVFTGRVADVPLTKQVYENGILTVRVLTELTAPITTADINVLVFVRGCENLEFACPREIDYQSIMSPFTVQSGMLAYDNEEEDVSSIALKPSVAPPGVNLMYFGESIQSLRTLLRRTSFLRTGVIPSGSGSAFIMQLTGGEFNRYPMYPGFDPNGINTATGPTSGISKPYNWVNYTPITWLGQCFLANRGAIHWRVNPLNPELNCETRLERPGNTQALTVAGYKASYGGGTTSNLCSRLMVAASVPMAAGGTITNNRTLSGVSASFPFYSPYKFRTSAPSDAVLGNAFDFSSVDKCSLIEVWTPKTSITRNADWASGNNYNYYVGAGTDFTFIFFLAVPTIYVYTAIPAAV